MTEKRLEYFRKYRELNRLKLRMYNRKYNKAWRDQYGYESEMRWNKKNLDPVKTKARQVVNYWISRGVVRRKPCEYNGCGNKKVHAHHPDYRRPLKVVFLCPVHHSHLHLGKITLSTRRH